MSGFQTHIFIVQHQVFHFTVDVMSLHCLAFLMNLDLKTILPYRHNSWVVHVTGVCWPASFSSGLISLDWFYFAHNLTGDILKYRYSFCSVFLSRDVNDLELRFWVRMCLAAFQTMCHTWLFRTSVKSQITLWDTARPFPIYFMWLCLWEIV